MDQGFRCYETEIRFPVPLELGSRQSVLVDTLSEQNLCSQSFETVSSTDAVHDADQVVERFCVSVRNRMLEVVEDVWHPIREGSRQMAEGVLHFWCHRSTPRFVLL